MESYKGKVCCIEKIKFKKKFIRQSLFAKILKILSVTPFDGTKLC